MSNIMPACPKCGKVAPVKTDGDKFRCATCGKFTEAEIKSK